MGEDESIRVFLAVELPAEIKERIGIIQEGLKPVLKGVRWVRPCGIHLTLKFFGNIVSSQIPPISKAVRSCVARQAPLNLVIEGTGGFPSRERARVLWMGVRGDVASLIELQKSIGTVLEPLGFLREKRPFHPHLTLGRAKSGRGMIAGIEETAYPGSNYEAGTFEARGLALFRSDLKSTGAVYTKLAIFPFNG